MSHPVECPPLKTPPTPAEEHKATSGIPASQTAPADEHILVKVDRVSWVERHMCAANVKTQDVKAQEQKHKVRRTQVAKIKVDKRYTRMKKPNCIGCSVKVATPSTTCSSHRCCSVDLLVHL
jgi:hypothetical protein